MKKLAWILVLPLISSTLFLVAFNAGLLQPFIEERLNANPGLKVSLGEMQIAYRWPPTLELRGSSISMPIGQLNFENLRLEMTYGLSQFTLRAVLLRPNLKLKHPLADFFNNTSQQAETAPNPQATNKPKPQRRFKVDFDVKEGLFVSPDLELKNFSLNFKQSNWLAAPASLDLTTLIKSSQFPLPLPVTIKGKFEELTREKLKADDLSMEISGLKAKAKGVTLFSDSQHRWKISLDAPDLAKLPKPPLDLPAKNYQGAIKMNFEIVQIAAESPLEMEGEVSAKQIRANLNYAQNGMEISGPVRANLTSRFAYSAKGFEIPEVSLDVDLTEAQVSIRDYLEKKPQVRFHATLQAATEKTKIKIKQLQVWLWNFVARVSGDSATNADMLSNLAIELKRTNLAGLEALVIPLKAFPVKGSLELSARYTGPLKDFASAELDVQRVSLSDFSAYLDFRQTPDFSARGPVLANIEGQFLLRNKVPLNANINGKVDLSRTELRVGPYGKKENEIFNIQGRAKTLGDVVQIESLQTQTHLGQLNITGSIKRSAVPTLDLSVKIPELSLTQARVALPTFASLIPMGQIHGTLALKGALDTSKNWYDWALNVGGDLYARLPLYEIPSPSGTGSKSDASPPAPAPDAQPVNAFLPRGELTKNLLLGLKVDLQKFKMNKLETGPITLNGQVSNGVLRSRLFIQSLFEGTLELKDLQIPLLVQAPVIQSSVNWQNLNIKKTLAFVKADYESWASGRTNGQGQLFTAMPQDPEFVKKLNWTGEVLAKPVVLHTVKIGEMVNGFLTQLPFNVPLAKVEPFQGQMSARIIKKLTLINVEKLLLLDNDGSELQAKGVVRTEDLNSDLAGVFYWSKPPVEGCLLEGNADEKGRLTVPLAIKGKLSSPEFSWFSDSTKKLLAQALNCEKKKLLKKAQTHGEEQLKKEVKNVLKGILGK